MGSGLRTLAALGLWTVSVLPASGQTPAPPSPPPATAPTQTPRPTAPSANELTVTGSRPGVTTSIDSRAYLIDRDLGASTGSLADALRNVPSVQVDMEGNLSLRGDEGVQILVDGKPSPLFVGEGRKQALLNFPAKDIERVEVMTTPSAAFSPEGSGKRLTAQGYNVPFATLNFGWRHKVDNRVAATLTLRDVFDTTRYKNVTDTPLLRGTSTNTPRAARAAWFQLTYAFGASKPAEPSFDYGGGAAAN